MQAAALAAAGGLGECAAYGEGSEKGMGSFEDGGGEATAAW
jgi:hypothetical protein